MYKYIYLNIHIYIGCDDGQIHLCIPVHTCKLKYIRIQKHICTYTYVHIYIYKQVNIDIVYVCIYVCIYIYKWIPNVYMIYIHMDTCM